MDVRPAIPGRRRRPPLDMSITVGWNTAVEAGLTRQASTPGRSGRTSGAVDAIDEGRFVDEIVPDEGHRKDGSGRPGTVDEHPAAQHGREAGVVDVLHPEIDGLLDHRRQRGRAQRRRRRRDGAWRRRPRRRARPRRRWPRIRSWASVGVEPARTGMAPDRGHPEGARPRPDWPSAMSTCSRSTRPSPPCRWPHAGPSALDEEIVNVSGSGCSLGHPVAATGARMVATMIYELRAAVGASAWRRCAPAGAWARPWSSRWPADRRGRPVEAPLGRTPGNHGPPAARGAWWAQVGGRGVTATTGMHALDPQRRMLSTTVTSSSTSGGLRRCTGGQPRSGPSRPRARGPSGGELGHRVALATGAVTHGDPGEPDAGVLGTPGLHQLVERRLAHRVATETGPRWGE